MQRRVAELVGNVEPSLRLDQDCGDRQIAFERCNVEPGARFLVRLVGAVAAGDKLAHLVRVIIGGGARDVVVIDVERVEIRPRTFGAHQQHDRRGAAQNCDATVHDIRLACGMRSSSSSQSSAASIVSTEGPGSAGGRRTMMTGRLNSRAAVSLASVAAPPLALQTTTSMP